MPSKIDHVFEKDLEALASQVLKGEANQLDFMQYVSRQLTYRYTCQLTALHAAEISGNAVLRTEIKINGCLKNVTNVKSVRF